MGQIVVDELKTSAELEAAIEKATVDFWSTNKYPLLLSQLGVTLDKLGDYRVLMSPLKLRQFIATRLSSRVVIVTHPQQTQKTGLIPVGEQYSFVKSPVRTGGTEIKLPAKRIKPAIWAAFVKPLADDAKRFLDVADEGLRFVDLKADLEPPSDTHEEITRDLIVDGSGPHYDPDVVLSRIQTWGEQRSVDVEKLYTQEPQKRQRISLFDIFDGLSDSDLRRIDIPFDIVYKIIKK